MATWQERVKALFGDDGYQDCMRRSLQTIILYEARRAVEPRQKSLRPYQRKAAFMEQCYFLLDSLVSPLSLYANRKTQVMWKTLTKCVPLDNEAAWVRLKGINKELKDLSEQIKPFMAPGRSHQDAVDLLVQSMYEGKDRGNKGPRTKTWEYLHNHCLAAFRLYYDGDKLDAEFPVTSLCPNMKIPIARPPSSKSRQTAANSSASAAVDSDEPAIDVAAILGEGNKASDDRRQLLQEVRQHLDILKEFEGVISDDEIARRKRELFLSLPPAPIIKKKRRETSGGGFGTL